MLGKTALDLCPASALLSYVECRTSEPGRFFLTLAKKPHKVNLHIQNQEDARQSWFPHYQYTGHSFRFGAATSAALVGVEDYSVTRSMETRHLSALHQDTRRQASNMFKHPCTARAGKEPIADRSLLYCGVDILLFMNIHVYHLYNPYISLYL